MDKKTEAAQCYLRQCNTFISRPTTYQQQCSECMHAKHILPVTVCSGLTCCVNAFNADHHISTCAVYPITCGDSGVQGDNIDERIGA
jgi:hypothetical protein